MSCHQCQGSHSHGFTIAFAGCVLNENPNEAKSAPNDFINKVFTGSQCINLPSENLTSWNFSKEFVNKNNTWNVHFYFPRVNDLYEDGSVKSDG